MDRTETRNDTIDRDRTEGSMKQMGGSVKSGVGDLVGDEKMKREGEADKSEGKLQNAWGGIKDKAREMTGDKDRR